MYLTTAFVALLASTFVAASPNKVSVICNTKTYVTTKTYVNPTTIEYTKTHYLPSTSTYDVPSTTCKTVYHTYIDSTIAYSKSPSVYKSPVTTVYYVDKTKQVDVPYTSWCTDVETTTKDIVTKVCKTTTFKVPHPTTTCSTKYGTSIQLCTESSSVCKTTTMPGYYMW